MYKKYCLFLITFLFITSQLFPQTETALLRKLKSFKEITGITPVKHDTILFSEAYEMMIFQPLDHNKPNGIKFKQRIFLSHRNDSFPGFSRIRIISGEKNNGSF